MTVVATDSFPPPRCTMLGKRWGPLSWFGSRACESRGLVLVSRDLEVPVSPCVAVTTDPGPYHGAPVYTGLQDPVSGAGPCIHEKCRVH